MFLLCLVTMPFPLRTSPVCIFFSYGWSRNQKGLLLCLRRTIQACKHWARHCSKLWKCFREPVVLCMGIKARDFIFSEMHCSTTVCGDPKQSSFLSSSPSFYFPSVAFYILEYVLRWGLYWGFRLREKAAPMHTVFIVGLWGWHLWGLHCAGTSWVISLTSLPTLAAAL